ncbi:MAG: outer membrane lipoprotein-sorting protein [Ignavibacteria bacterium GWF2_33_9]|nr:MAG: outer membrane lipoprotein-sorting protein [Ignavibacteria bacterium GWF2_33_9]
MKYIKFLLIFLLAINSETYAKYPDAAGIIKKIDENMFSTNRVFESVMTINGKRSSRSIVSRTYSVGDEKSFTEYLSPASEKGTKMLKLDNQLWIYSPGTDRIIQISGHLLRQSVMGSDLSYEDMMEERKLTDIYDAKVIGEEEISNRKCWVMELTAKVEDVAYFSQKLWVDQESYVPIREDLFGKSGKLLKRATLENIKKIQGRWFPMKFTYKDMLKEGNGTVFEMTDVKFDQKIPAYIFSKASLKK